MTCGAEDCLLEDSIFMACKWMMAGGHAVLQLYSGSPHGLMLLTLEEHENARIDLRDVAQLSTVDGRRGPGEPEGPGSTMFDT